MFKFDSKNAKMWSKLGLRGAFGAIGLMEAGKNANVLAVTTDTSGLLGLERFKKTYPQRFFNVGIAEQNAIGIAAGLCDKETPVFVNSYASFITARGYEFVRQNLGYLGSNVKVVGCASGVMTGKSGISHWCIDDISLMRIIPNLLILSPADAMEAVKIAIALSKCSKPAYVRLCGGTSSSMVYEDDYDFRIGKAIQLREGKDVAIVATGLLVKDSLDAAEELEQEGISCSVYNFHTIKPLDTETLEKIYTKYSLIVTIEEHSVIGGLGGAVAEHKAGFTRSPRQIFMGITDEYKKTGSRPYILEQYGLTKSGIKETICKNFARGE